MDPDPAPDPNPFISKQISKENLDSYCFVTSVGLFRVLITLSRPQQHSHSREKVLVKSLLHAKRVLVDLRGLERALEAVRVSVEAVRVSVEAMRVSIEALRCFRGRERLENVN